MDRRLSAGLRCGVTEEKKRKPRQKPVSHSDDEKQALGKSLAAARAQAGYTMDAAAKALGLADKQAIDNYEKGRNVIDALRLKQLARFYGTTTDALTGMTGGAVWRFSIELLREVQQLQPEDLPKMEGNMWSWLRKPMPETLHYSEEEYERTKTEKPKPSTVITTSAPPSAQQRKAS